MAFRLLLFLILCAILPAQENPKVLIIGIDGLSPESFERAEMPNMKALLRLARGTLAARGVLPTVSSPNWASVIMGAGPELHGVTSNEWQRDKLEIPAACKGPEGIFPTVFSVLREAKPQLKLAAIYDWDGFGRLMERSAANYAEHVLHSEAATKAAIRYWRAQKPDLLFLHLDDVDHAGHEHAWGSPKYFAEVARIDGLVGELLAATEADKPVVILVADHAGTGKSHGHPTQQDLLIPLLVAGPGIPPGTPDLPVKIYDIAPTITALYGVAPHPCWVGRSLLPAAR